MIYTSYFSFVKNVPAEFLVSIAGRAPDGFAGIEFRRLAPRYEWWKEWHDKKLSEDWYVQKYYETVLNKLNPADIARELNNKIVLCWEAPDKFCHRHLVADWIYKNTGICVRELSMMEKSGFIK